MNYCLSAVSNWGKVILYNILFAIVLVFIFCPSCFFTVENFINSLDNILYSFALCIFLGYGNSYLVQRLDQKISWIEAPVKRLLVGTFVVVFYSFAVSIIIAHLHNVLTFDREALNIATWSESFEAALLPVYISIIITVILTSRSFLMAWKKSTIDAERLKRENLQAQYDALKNQISPHFLFNSFNVLTDLVYMDQDRAARFIQQLSQVFRYVLESSKKELVYLQAELDFLNSYIFLLKSRFGDNLEIQFPGYKDKGDQIIPLCLQMLIENAVKHNVVSEEEKLKIEIKVEADYVCVRNNLQLKNLTEASTKLGLENIRSRYELLIKKQIKVEQTKEFFTVYIPLISTI